MARRKLVAVLLGVAFVVAVDGALGWLLRRLKSPLSLPCSVALALRPVAQRNSQRPTSTSSAPTKIQRGWPKVGSISSSSDHRRIARGVGASRILPVKPNPQPGRDWV